jgi:hypothetical protein
MEAKNASPHGDAFELLEQRASRVTLVAQPGTPPHQTYNSERVIVLPFSVSPPSGVLTRRLSVKRLAGALGEGTNGENQRENASAHLSSSGSLGHLYDILRERKPVSPDVAVRFDKLFGDGAGVWVRMQAAYDTWHTEREEDVSGIPTLRPRAA